MKILLCRIAWIILLSVLLSCQRDKPIMVKFTGETQGTYFAVTYFEDHGKDLQPGIDSLLKKFDRSVSLWDSTSILTRINNNSDVTPDKILTELFRLSKEVNSRSGGAFDPTVGPLVNAWGFGFKEKKEMDQKEIDSLLILVGFHNTELTDGKIIKFDPRVQFDFNAIAQGYAVDLIGKFLESKGIKNYLIDIGGEVLSRGTKPGEMDWQVGIETPKDNAMYGEGLTAIVKLRNKALSTSGSYRKFYLKDGRRLSHTIDPETGYPVQHSLLSVSVLADNCALADAWATVFMVWGLEKSQKFLETEGNLEAFFISSDENNNNQIYYSHGFKEILTEEVH